MAPTPFNYATGGMNPVDAMFGGMEFGQNQRQGEQDMLAGRQAMELNASQEARTQTQFGQQNVLFDQGQQDRQTMLAEQEAARANAQKMQGDLVGLSEKVASGNATSNDFAAMATLYPDLTDEMAKMWEGQAAERKGADIANIYKAASAIKVGKPEIAIDMLEERAVAAEAAGDKQEADIARAMAATIKIDPNAGLTSLGMLLHAVDDKASLELFGAGKPSGDRFKVVGDTLVDLDAPGSPAAVDLGGKANGPEWRAATPEEAAKFNATAGQINTKTGKFEAENGPSGLEVRTNPDGTTSVIQGAGAGRGKPTEGNLSAEGYLQRMRGAEQVFQALEGEGTVAIGLTDTVAVGTRAEPFKLTVPEQKLVQAQRDWVRAKLRKESGAVIGPEEMAEEIRTYFPQPGEGPEIVLQKKDARRRAEEQMQIGAGFGPTEAAGSGSPEQSGAATFDPSEIDALMNGP